MDEKIKEKINKYNNLIDSLVYTTKSVENILNRSDSLELSRKTHEVNKENYTNSLETWERCKEEYKVAVNSLYEKSIGALKNTLNIALQTIITDKNYEINIELEDKRGSKALSFSLIDNDEEGMEVDLKDGVGQGVRTIISFVLKINLY